jgi:hypothetical protein
LTQGDPDAALEESGNRLRSYVVLSDLSAEAGYAIEWCIGYALTVLDFKPGVENLTLCILQDCRS